MGRSPVRDHTRILRRYEGSKPPTAGVVHEDGKIFFNTRMWKFAVDVSLRNFTLATWAGRFREKGPSPYSPTGS